MFTTFLQELRSYFGKGYLLAVFFPTLIFASLNFVFGLEVTLGLERALQRWADLSTEAKILLPVTGLIGLAFIAYLIHNLQLVITRLFEGYWEGTPLWWLYTPRRRVYERQWDYLGQQLQVATTALEQAEEQHKRGAASHAEVEAYKKQVNRILSYWLMYFPPPGQRTLVQPTHLGNILRASELYAQDHYGIESVVIWPRLRPLLKGSIVDALQDTKIAMDFMLLMTLYAGLFTLIWSLILALFTDRWGLFVVSATGLPLASICYHSAIQNALAYSEQIKTAFDLHRHELLNAMGIKIPEHHEQERSLWETISLFFHNNIPPQGDEPQSSIYQRAINPQETYRYLIIEPPADEPIAWKRMEKAASEFGKGLREVFDTKGKK